MLTSKQRAYLRSLANTAEPILQIGKGGFSESVATAALEALTARELIKIRALKNYEGSLKDLAVEVATVVGAELVQVIGRNFVLYKANSEEPKIELP